MLNENNRMSRLREILDKKLGITNTRFKRYLYEEIDWNLPLIIISGARGSGKTTLLLQYLKTLDLPYERAFYVSLDDPYFEANRLWSFGEAFYKNGGRHLLLDEVHKYAHWSKDIKYLHDNYADLKVIATGSSILDLIKGEGDLSRRAAFYHLYGLSFREYLNVVFDKKLNSYSLKELITDHGRIAAEIADQIDPLDHFSDYLKLGYYPYFLQNKSQYLGRLVTTTNLMIENDIPAFEPVDYPTIRGIKKLMYILTESVPFKPNVKKLSERIGTSRNLLLKMFDLLSRVDLLLLLKAENKGVSQLAKPDKIFLQNTNLLYALSEVAPNVGQQRETFFYNQVQVRSTVTTPKFGDFAVDRNWLFEVGGASKSTEQIAGLPNAYLAVEDIKYGSGQRVPLWLFGFLY